MKGLHAFAATKSENATVCFCLICTKYPQRLKCTANFAAEQIASWCSGAVSGCLQVLKLVNMHTFGTKLVHFYANETHCKKNRIHKQQR